MAQDQRDGLHDISQVRAAFDALSEADWRRALKLARRFCKSGDSWSPEDLLQEAVARLLGGERGWSASLDALGVLLSVMRSIASSWIKAKRRSRIAPGVEVASLDAAPVDEDDDEVSVRAFTVDSVTPEQIAVGDELFAAVERSIEKDEPALLVCLAWIEGSRGKEAMEQLGMDTNTYDAARKRLMRALDVVVEEWNNP
jgi:DNA-directed RNA polymerase specialized sigma24 family protein